MIQQSQARNAADDARSAQLARELARQDDFRAETSEVLDRTVRDFDQPNQEQALEENVQRRAESAENFIPEGDPANLQISGSAPEVVKTSIAKQMADAMGRGKEDIRNRARLEALMKDTWLGNDLSTMRGGRDIGMVSNFAGESSRLNQFERDAFAQDAFNKKMSGPLGIFGDVLSTAGQGVGLYGASGGSFGDLFGSSPRYVGIGATRPGNFGDGLRG